MADEETREPEPVPFLSLFPWDVERWFGSMTRALISVAAQGAYMNLCWSAWRQQPECLLPDNDHALAKMSGCASIGEWESLKSAVFAMEPWTYSTRGWIHDVVLDTYLESVTKYRARLASSKRAGRESARVRRSEQKIKSQVNGRSTDVQRTLNPPSPSPSPSPSVASQPNTPPTPPATAGGNGQQSSQGAHTPGNPRARIPHGAALAHLIDEAVLHIRERFDAGDELQRPGIRNVRRRFRDWFLAGMELEVVKAKIDRGEHLPRLRL